jgi:hypothetical protein
MRNPHGILITSGPDGVVEADTFLCNHCNGIVMVKPKQAPEDIGGMCKQCMGMTCPRCTAQGSCTPFEKALQQQEARYHARRSFDFACR